MFFSKNSKKDKGTTRRSSSNNTELKELRVKARRRLIGALALVLAAFIVVPLLFDDPAPDRIESPIVVPAAPDSLSDGTNEELFNQNFTSLESDPITENGASGQITDTLASDLGIDDIIGESSQIPDSTIAGTDSTAKKTDEAVNKINEKVEQKSEKAVKNSSDSNKSSDEKRTDDGSVALALLEGKAPANTSQAAAPGNYYLQVAAYTTEQDANTRRDSLIKSGVSNAYVESGESKGQTVYRLRVGPFSSQQAAQAAQTRLRALGYPNGLISAK